MIYAVIILVVVVVVLVFMLYSQKKSTRQQAEDQQQLLSDYQRRVDEQQKLLEDYRSLEKNFNNVGEGYEQALLAFDKMQENQEKIQSVNDTLQQRILSMQRTIDDTKKKDDIRKEILGDMAVLVKDSGDTKLAALIGRIGDIDDLPADLPPFEPTDNVMVSQVAEEAIRLSGIATVDYITFEQTIADAAAATMLHTNLIKAVRALTHLLDNALKFTAQGGVKLSVDVDMDKNQAVYKVTDTGSGIAADDAERIFEPYVKLNQFFGGQGIGLTVARNIARRLGGDLVLDTTAEGPGATFVLTLPL